MKIRHTITHVHVYLQPALPIDRPVCELTKDAWMTGGVAMMLSTLYALRVNVSRHKLLYLLQWQCCAGVRHENLFEFSILLLRLFLKPAIRIRPCVAHVGHMHMH